MGRSEFFGSPEFDPPFNGAIDEFRISNAVRYTGNTFTPSFTEFATDANTVALYHFNEGARQTSADAAGNLGDALLGTTTTVETIDPSWAVASTLPIYILQFDAQKHDDAILLTWKVYTTGEGGQFVIEHSSDGNHFQTIGKKEIPAAQGTFDYSFTDRNYNYGRNYYRLKVLETNATPKYSSIISIDVAANGFYKVYPTVTSAQIFVKIPQAATIGIYNAGGMLVQKLRLSASQNINVQGLPAGMYQVVFEGSTRSTRFIKL